MKQIDYTRYLSSVSKTDLNTTYNYRLKIKHRLSRIFDTIPANSIINKGRCGIGGTYLEIKARRNSIIIVPTNAIIDNKCFDSSGVLWPKFLDVRGRFYPKHFAELKQFIESDQINKKIFCTPEGLDKIIKCGVDVEMIYNDWFLLLDEAHTLITDAFRGEILKTFQYFFNFKYKTVISATPYTFSDPRFDHFDIYNIRFRGYVGRMELINTINVNAVLYTRLINPKYFPGRVHIFLNSVSGIAQAIRTSQITDCSIFCRDEKENLNKLDELRGYHKEFPSEETFSKFNFYTSKYFEGWDLNDANATIIVISDINNLTLKTGVSNKCVQAAGRNRRYSHKIIHITNHRSIDDQRPFKQIEDETLVTASSAINNWNNHLVDLQNTTSTPDKDFEEVALKYSDLDEKTQYATINHSKVDQIINQLFCNQEYNHINYIHNAWERSGYKVKELEYHVPKLPADVINLNKTNGVRVMVEFLEALHKNSERDFPGYKAIENLLPENKEDIISYYNLIGPDRIRALGCNLKLITVEFNEKRNELNRSFVKEKYFAKFDKTRRSINDIRALLEELYFTFEIVNPKTSTIMTAHAADLKGMFTKVKQCKILGENGYYIDLY